MVDNRTYGIPYDGEMTVQTYRKDLYDAKGLKPADTLTTFVKNAKALHDPANRMWGFCLRGMPGAGQNMYIYPSILGAYGGKWFDSGGKIKVNSPRPLRRSSGTSTTNNTYAPQAAQNWNWPDIADAFAQGTIGCYIDGHTAVTVIANPERSKVVGKIGFARWPKGPVGRRVSSIWNWAMPINSALPEKARQATWLCIQWACCEETQMRTSYKFKGPGKRYDVNRLSMWKTPEYVKTIGGRGRPLPQYLARQPDAGHRRGLAAARAAVAGDRRNDGQDRAVVAGRPSEAKASARRCAGAGRAHHARGYRSRLVIAAQRLALAERPERRFALVMAAPGVLVLAATTTFPLVYLVWQSLQSINLAMPGMERFVGADNYTRMLADARFWGAFGFTLTYAGVTVALQLALGLGMALLILQIPRAQWAFRVAAILPIVLAPVVAGLFWRTLMLAPDFGVVDFASRSLGLGSHNWLGDPQLARVSVIAIHTWQWTPFVFLYLLAALAALPADLFEAARIDRANTWRRFVHITLPLLRPAIVVVVILRITVALSAFAAIYAATGGGPGTSTEIVNLYAYRVAFAELSLGYGAAAAVVLLALTLAVAGLLFRLRRSR